MMEIRPAAIAELPAIMALDRASPSAGHWSERQYRELLEKDVGSAEKLVLVAAADAPSSEASKRPGQQLAGFLAARGVQSDWELENIVVAAGARRGGVGTRLLQGLLAHIRQAGGGSVFLEVRESNTAARRLYEKAGFRKTGLRKSYYNNPSEDAVLYHRRIG